MRQKQHNKISNSMFELSDEEIYNLIANGNIRTFPKEFWEGEDGNVRAGKVIRHLIEDILKWDINTVIKEYSKKTLVDNKLRGLLINVFDNNEMEAIKCAYPELKVKGNEIIKTLTEMTFNNEKIPSKDNIEKLYSEDIIKFFFKSFQNLNIILKNDYSRQELIDMLKAKKKKLGKNPSNLDMKVPQAIIFIREFDTVNWNEILVKAGL